MSVHVSHKIAPHARRRIADQPPSTFAASPQALHCGLFSTHAGQPFETSTLYGPPSLQQPPRLTTPSGPRPMVGPTLPATLNGQSSTHAGHQSGVDSLSWRQKFGRQQDCNSATPSPLLKTPQQAEYHPSLVIRQPHYSACGGQHTCTPQPQTSATAATTQGSPEVLCAWCM